MRALWESQGGDRAGVTNGPDCDAIKQRCRSQRYLHGKREPQMVDDLTQPPGRNQFGQGSVGTEEFRSSLGETTGRPTYLDPSKLHPTGLERYTFRVLGVATLSAPAATAET